MVGSTPLELPDPTAVRHVAIVGTGVIGAGWAAVFAARHYNVTAFVRSAHEELERREREDSGQGTTAGKHQASTQIA